MSYTIERCKSENINTIVAIHMDAFDGFFLTFLGASFLRVMYHGYLEHEQSNLLIARDEDGDIFGFVAYSKDIGAFYRHLLNKHFLRLALQGARAALKQPRSSLRLIRALRKPRESNQDRHHVALTSIAVAPRSSNAGIGRKLIDAVKRDTDFSIFDSIRLETDADNNDRVRAFYVSNGFKLVDQHITAEGRRMCDYAYRPSEQEIIV